MHEFGISLYPEHSNAQADKEYMELASKYGFTRIFTCLLSVDKPAEETIAEFSEFMNTAHDFGFKVAVDTNPEVFEHLGATPYNLEVFNKMGVDIIRLDGHFDDRSDIAITQNPYGIKIEYNASQNSSLSKLIERGADKANMVVCHNFYPEKYTGLSEETFEFFSNMFVDAGLKTAAFVSSQQDNTFGPWPVYEGLPTCEEDRRRPIDLQVRHLIATRLIDDILIGNCFASEEELRAVSSVDTTKTTMKIDFAEDVTDLEKDLVLNLLHTTRGDASGYMLRSSYARLDFMETNIPARESKSKTFKRGDVLVVNDNLTHYRGELHVALKDMENDGTRNLVGCIPEEELFLLDYIKPDYPFGFID